MSRVAVVRDSDLPGRDTDEPIRSSRDPELAELRAGIFAAGHELVEPSGCEVAVVALTRESRGLAERRVPGVPCVVVFARRADDLANRVVAETDRSSLESRADAYVLGAGQVASAIAWVAIEDRAARSAGAPRLVVVGSIRDDFGMVRAISAEPLILGRAMSFAQHPQRPDRLPTPTGAIARLHARVRNVDGALAVADLGSTNGTLVLRQGQPVRLLCPQQAGSGREYGPPATTWLIRDPAVDGERQTGAWVSIQIGDELQLPGFWRFRVDGDATWRPEE